MHRSGRSLALVAAGLIAATAAAAQESSPTKPIFDDGRVRVQEVRFRPGDQGPNIPRPFRVIRVLEGGTIQRIFPDGTSEKIEYRTGEVKVYPAEKPFVPKNVGTTDIVFFVVAVRD